MNSIERVRVIARDGHSESEREDSLAVEEPLEIRLRVAGSSRAEPVAGAARAESVAGRSRAEPVAGASRAEPFVTTMRTPGHDEELAAGLLFAEGVLTDRSDLAELSRPSDPRIDAELKANVMIATISAEALSRSESLRRRTVMGSACGVCGKTSIDNVLSEGRPPISSAFRLDPAVLIRLPDLLRSHQSVFSQTGGLHGAGLFDASGALEALREDIGRHNAVDKVVGEAWLASRLPLSDRVLVVSGRAGFEIAQKAAAAGIPVLASVSAPSSLAVELADAAGLTLIGFLRGERYNVYAHPHRLRPIP